VTSVPLASLLARMGQRRNRMLKDGPSGEPTTPLLGGIERRPDGLVPAGPPYRA
jgi:hypothetical protein